MHRTYLIKTYHAIMEKLDVSDNILPIYPPEYVIQRDC